MTIDDQLREIIQSQERFSVDMKIAQIKSAFADYFVENTPHAVLTGEQWYDRFNREYGKTHGTGMNGYQEQAYLAARKAAGL